MLPYLRWRRAKSSKLEKANRKQALNSGRPRHRNREDERSENNQHGIDAMLKNAVAVTDLDWKGGMSRRNERDNARVRSSRGGRTTVLQLHYLC